jgi:hypothetical protein
LTLAPFSGAFLVLKNGLLRSLFYSKIRNKNGGFYARFGVCFIALFDGNLTVI